MLPHGFWAALLGLSLLSQIASRAQNRDPGAHDARVEVLFFAASDCTYSDRYFPEMNMLQHKFLASGVAFRWIYPNQTEKLTTIRAHQQQFGASPDSAVLDTDGSVTHLARVHVTPEAAVLVRSSKGSWITAYHGRIDDRYVRIGLERPHAEHHDLQDAIEAVLANKPVPKPGGPAIGCAIMGPAS